MNKKILCFSIISLQFAHCNKEFTKKHQKQIDQNSLDALESGNVKSWMILDRNYSYEYGYGADRINFVQDDIEEFSGRAKKDLIFLNFHGLARLSVPGEWQPGDRTLSWLTPFGCSLQNDTLFTKNTVHKKLALLKAWSNNAERSFVSFVIIPKGSLLEFQCGTALEQSNKKETMNGGGLQFRIKELPKGTLVLTELLDKKEHKDSISKKSFDLAHKLEHAIKKYNDNNPGHALPQNMITENTHCFTRDEFLSDSLEELTAIPNIP